ncbi:ATPase domain-containing protein [Salarchaeum sp. JOR-1]|uniref:ATPase domain-containing protein n=1 Tax=Salarchaeum sp. JOR-1 TaxID=2599399 RepID=UPI00119850ED|nr:AAA family ATPase [Salarchaeum sp. JOR-1]
MTTDRLGTGIDGLDSILHGGLIPNRGYLVRGGPGAGKTILGSHFLQEGTQNGESALFVNLEESEEDIKRNAKSLGFELTDIEFLDLSPDAAAFADDQSYSILSASEVEQEPFIEKITTTIEDIDPDRVFVDPITQLRYLTPDQHQFRKQAIGFMEYLTAHGATVLFTSQDTEATSDEDLQFLSDGTIELQRTDAKHTISVPKFRGSSIKDGEHAVTITGSGLSVFPELQPEQHASDFVSEPISSGVPELDELLNGGIERGTVTVISGPTGAGKTTLGSHFMKEAADRGERSLMYLFEESAATLRNRTEAINIPVKRMEERGNLQIEEMEPLDISPQRFAQKVQTEVEENDTEVVMIDGISGYQLSIQGDQQTLNRRLHALCRYLKNMGVTVILVDESTTLTGDFAATDTGMSYLADNILFLRHIEYQGELRKIIGVLKKRTSDFERSLRELKITSDGVTVGDSLTGLRGVLSGTPEWTDEDSSAGN